MPCSTLAEELELGQPPRPQGCIVDGLWHVCDYNLGLAPHELLRDRSGPAHGAVAADGEDEVDARLLNGVANLARVMPAARGAEDGAALPVDGLDVGEGELLARAGRSREPASSCGTARRRKLLLPLGSVEPFIAVPDPVDHLPRKASVKRAR